MNDSENTEVFFALNKDTLILLWPHVWSLVIIDKDCSIFFFWVSPFKPIHSLNDSSVDLGVGKPN